jgi:glutamine synthetase
MEPFEKEQVVQLAEENNVSFIRLQFTDMFGMLKNIAVTINQLERALDGRLAINSPSINEYCQLEESNIYLKPDPSTFSVFPWRPREGAVARLICNLEKADGEPFPGCVRNVLKQVSAEAAELGFSAVVSSKAKFFLFLSDEKGNPVAVPHDKGTKFDLTPQDLGENARREIILNLEEMGFDIETSHHEFSPGQHEITFRADDLLISADGIQT